MRRSVQKPHPSSPPSRATPAAISISPGRRWVFRLMVVLGLPLGLLAALELGLRLAGYGYPTSFLVPRKIHGEDMLVDNPKFGWRFFPHAIARSPSPIAIRARKPEGVYRIFLFGESAALGDPRPSCGVARFLEAMLTERFPGTRFEVVPAAMTAINSHVMLPIARECAGYEGDLWIVYPGNNEYIGPYGPNSVFGTASLPLPAVRLNLALLKSRTGQAAVAIAAALRGGAAKSDWGGLKMFREHQIAASDPRRAEVQATYRRNLEDLVRAGVHARVPVVLVSMASNLKDCAPFGSLHSPPLGARDEERWRQWIQEGATHADKAAWAEAEKSFEQAAQASPHHAETLFRLAQSQEALGRIDRARASYLAARDEDAMPFRADSPLNAALQQVAKAHPAQSVFFVDAEKALAEASPQQLPGRGLFYEHVHLTPEGNYRLALSLAEAVRARLPGKVSATQTPAWADADACHRRMGLTDWNRSSMLEDIVGRLADAPYTGQFNHQTRRQQLLDQLAETRERLHPRNVMDVQAACEEAVRQDPGNYWLHQNYAEFLELSRNLPLAVREWDKVADLLPHHHAAFYHRGRLLVRLKQFDEARAALETVLRIRPDLEEVHLELGKACAGQRQWDEALKQYATAQRLRPDDPRPHLHRADVLAAQNKREEAMDSLRQAIRIRPSFSDARYLLGVELAVDEKYGEALGEFQEVVRLRPDYASARFNLAVTLAKLKRYGEAVEQFQETLKRDPDHAQAKEYLEALQAAARKQP